MKRGTIFRNLGCRREVYFVLLGSARTAKNEAKATSGYEVECINGKWAMRTAQYYTHALKDEAYFRAAGVVDLEQACIQAILKAIGRNENG